MATTTNFGWETPDDTDLVKDGAAAIRTLGQSIDTSMADLEGGTTGQVLSKASNADMDFTWVTSDDANAIQNAIVDAKGDLIAATAADTPARLAVGTNGQILTADSTTSTGLKWATPAASGGSFTYIGGASFSSTSVQSVSNVFSATYQNYKIIFNIESVSTTGNLLMKLRSGSTDATTNYTSSQIYQDINSATLSLGLLNRAGDGWIFADLASGGDPLGVSINIFNPFRNVRTVFEQPSHGYGYTSTTSYLAIGGGVHKTAASYDGFTILPASGTFSGDVRVYGYSNS